MTRRDAVRGLGRAALLLAFGNVAAKVVNALAAPPVSGFFAPDLSDEFAKKEIDPLLWRTFLPWYSGAAHEMIEPNQVTVRGGVARLETHARNTGLFAVPLLQSKAELRYGYLEARVKAAQSRVNQAFWLYAWRENGTREIDIFEMAPGAAGEAHRLQTNVHAYDGNPELENDNNRRSRPRTWEDQKFLPLVFNTYALLWTPTRLCWYVNGVLIREMGNDDFHWPMKVCFSQGIHPIWRGMPTAAELPAVMEVDYVRVWRLTRSTSSLDLGAKA